MFAPPEMMSTLKRVAIAQMRSTSNKLENNKSVEKLFQLAKEKDANFLFLPECCDFVGENRKQTLELSEPLENGETVKFYRNLAKEHKMWLSAGGVHEAILNEKGEKTDKIMNAHVVINDLGDIVAVYRKLHMFDVNTPAFRFRESEVVEAGKKIVPPIETPIGQLGLQICYDMRFAEVSTLLRKAGAEILTARAIENQCYVFAPAQIGFHNEKRQSFGRAMIVEPWGSIVAECNETDLDVVTADIKSEAIEKVRTNMPCFEHRRKDIYGLASAAYDCNQFPCDRSFAEHNISKDTIFYETQHCYAFTNLRCVVEGHVLVSTKRKVKRLQELNCDETSDMFQTVCKIQKVLENYYKTTSTTVTVQDGPEAGQTVKHVHFHVMPRKEGDFKHNDQIYLELQKNDLDETKNRNLEDMVKEAQLYRSLMAKC
uniref:bis(5'-adenosyl)-triphosphatase n=1 Tax=Megaselia scalaris TaxID=36166 RepID=T1GAZ6_MEGSC